MTITNANFDDEAIENEIKKMITYRDELRAKANVDNLHDAARFQVDSKVDMLEKASSVGAFLQKMKISAL